MSRGGGDAIDPERTPAPQCGGMSPFLLWSKFIDRLSHQAASVPRLVDTTCCDSVTDVHHPSAQRDVERVSAKQIELKLSPIKNRLERVTDGYRNS